MGAAAGASLTTTHIVLYRMTTSVYLKDIRECLAGEELLILFRI